MIGMGETDTGIVRASRWSSPAGTRPSGWKAALDAVLAFGLDR